MLSQSRLYLALLSVVASVAFLLGLWSNSMQSYQKFKEPKPIGMLYYEQQYVVNRNIKQTNNEQPTTSGNTKHTHHPPSKITHHQGKFGMGHPPPVAKSLFSFASMRPGSKNHPFKYAAKLVGYRLATEQKKRNSNIFAHPPKVLAEIPKYEAKWKLAPEYRISDNIPAESARNILIATSWRSGSTFLGDLLNHYPGTFYSFEPLHYLDNRQRNTNGTPWYLFEPLDAYNMTRDIYHCDYNKHLMSGYLKHASKNENQFLFKHNFRIWNSCSTILPSSVACFMPELVKKTCNLFPIRLIKTVRLRVRFVEPLLTDPDLALKIIVLVRDPRGVMRSRSHMNWCDRPTCANSTRVCNDLDSDVASALKLGENYANRILLIRYEDLSIRPYQTVDKIINFLDLPPQPEFIDTYLKTHTGQLRSHELISESKQHNQKETPYSTSRKSSEETAFKWTKMLSMDEIQELENICQKPMAKLGYAKYNGEINNHRDILVKTAKEVWPF